MKEAKPSPLGALLRGIGAAASKLAPLADGVAQMKSRNEEGVCINCGEAPRLSPRVPLCRACFGTVGQAGLDVLVGMLERAEGN